MKRKILAVCMAVGILTVFAGCGSSTMDVAESKATAASTGGEVANQFETAANMDGMADDMAPEEAYGYDTAAPMESDTGTVDLDGSDPDISTSSAQKLIKTVDMSVETMEFDKFIAGVKAETEQIGGYVEHSEVSSSASEYSDRWANFTLRIPKEKLDEFVSKVGEDANVTYTNESTEDVTLSYVDMESHLKALRTEQETLLSMLEKVESLEDILAIQTQLTQVRYQIESYESQLRTYDNLVDYSTVYLNVSEVARETSSTGSTFGERVKTRFNDNVYRIGQGFRNFAIGFLGAIPFLIVAAVIVVVVLLVLRKVRKIRKNRKAKKENDEL